jgi:pimeloyl-ACP methyl ester carboxylesterase
MATYVFVHGSFHGAWCWREIVPRLEGKGHKCVVFDLPGHGNDPMPPQDVSFQDYVRALGEVIEDLPEAPIIVTHSMAGLICETAEIDPSRRRAIVYISGMILPDGKAMIELVNEFDPKYLEQIVWAPDRKTARLSEKAAREFAYGCCPATVFDQIAPLLSAEPVAPYETRIRIKSGYSDGMPRYYVECTKGRIIPISLQRKMRSEITFKKIYSIDTDHCPFFSAPSALSSILLSIAEEQLPAAQRHLPR